MFGDVLRRSRKEDKTILWQVGDRDEFFDLPVLANDTKEETSEHKESSFKYANKQIYSDFKNRWP